MKSRIDFDTVLQQLRVVKKLGNLRKSIGMIPELKLALVPLEGIDPAKIRRDEAMILAMTPEERRNPDLIDVSRKHRITRGSGTSMEELGDLILGLYRMR